MKSVLVLGATGYVGGRLVPRLLDLGYQVRCLVRSPDKLYARPWSDRVQVVAGDVLDRDSLESAFEGIDVVYYLVHSMAAKGQEFVDLDREAAGNTAQAASRCNVDRIVYLGGLGRREVTQSDHLKSRHEVGEVLRTGTARVTEFRAAIIVGAGSVSFEMVHHLVNRLPVMICPRWVTTRTQPIAIDDVIAYLAAAIEVEESAGQIIDIGGPDILNFRDMMLQVARTLNLKRYLIQVPLLTPRLSSYWVNLVTPIPASISRPLIDGLRQETICESDKADRMFSIETTPFKEAVDKALAHLSSETVATKWTDASIPVDQPRVDESHLRSDRQVVEVERSARETFSVVCSIGGDNGWYYADPLWQIRGFIDQQVGGVGLRRGRRHPSQIAVGDALDFWRVQAFEPNRRLLLRAEMRVWGRAWLEFVVEPIDENRCRLIQTARYYPRGLWGQTYWYSVYPLHAFVFRGMARAIGRRAEQLPTSGQDETVSEFER